MKRKSSLLDQIEVCLSGSLKDIDYDKIFKLNNFCHEVDKIYDWPFNPKSIKKLLASLGSPILPLIISFFGI
ncbi:MAG: hypothetical protein ACFE94_19450 [Candidatus Hodarchaeota archaeon]